MIDFPKSYSFPNTMLTDLLSLNGGSVIIHAIQIRNTTTGTVSVFLSGQPSATANPDFQVIPGQSETVAVSTKIIGLRFDGIDSGNLYVHITDQYTSNSSGVIPGLAPSQVPIEYNGQINASGQAAFTRSNAAGYGNQGIATPVVAINLGGIQVPSANAQLFLGYLKVTGVPPYVVTGLGTSLGGLGVLPTAIPGLITGPGEIQPVANPGTPIRLESHPAGGLGMDIWLAFFNLDFPATNPMSGISIVLEGIVQ